MKRRRFLGLLAALPAAPVVAMLPAPAPIVNRMSPREWASASRFPLGYVDPLKESTAAIQRMNESLTTANQEMRLFSEWHTALLSQISTSLGVSYRELAKQYNYQRFSPILKSRHTP